MYDFNIFSLLNFFVIELYLFLGIYILAKNPKKNPNKLFFLVALTMAIWSFGEGMGRAAIEPEKAFFWLNNIIPFGSTIHSALLLHFWLTFSGWLDTIKKKRMIFLLYIPSLFFLLVRLFFPSKMTTGVIKEYWGYSLTGTALYQLFMLYIIIYASIMVYLALKTSSKSYGDLKKQSRNIGLGVLFVIIVGICTQVIKTIIHTNIPEMTVISTFVFIVLIAYAVNKYGLLTITPEMAAENIIATMDDYLVVIDREKKISLVNQSTLDFLGKKKEKIVGQKIDCLKISENHSKKLMVHLDSQKNVDNLEIEIKNKNNEKVPVSINASTLNNKLEGYQGTVLVIRNIKDTKRMIKHIKKTNKELKNANEHIQTFNINLEKEVKKRTKEIKNANTRIQHLLDMKSKFVNQVAHDLRTPLTPISVLIPLVIKEIKESKNKNALKKLKTVMHNVNYLTLLVSDTLNISRIDAGKTELHFEKTNMRNLINQLCENNKITLARNDFSVLNKIKKNIPLIYIDRIRISEVINNLINNSIKYKNNKKINKIIFDAHNKNKEIIFSMKDTGVGIKKEHLNKIFDEFFKIDPSRHDAAASSGLGLSICKRIIKMHGGKIWAESNGINKGTTIKFSLLKNNKNV